MPEGTDGSDEALAGREIVSRRVVGYRRDVVFDAWSDPDQLAQWWGPSGFTR